MLVTSGARVASTPPLLLEELLLLLLLLEELLLPPPAGVASSLPPHPISAAPARPTLPNAAPRSIDLRDTFLLSLFGREYTSAPS